MPRYVFAFHGVAVFLTGLLLGLASYTLAVSSGDIFELIASFLALPVLYLGVSIIKEYEFANDALIVRQSIFREELQIPYKDINDVRLSYLKFYGTPPNFTLAIDYKGGSENVGFGFGINEDFLKSLEDRVGKSDSQDKNQNRLSS